MNYSIEASRVGAFVFQGEHMQEKHCSKCGLLKPLDLFGARKDRGGSPKSACKECARNYANNRRQSLPEMLKDREKAWRAEKPDKVKKKRDDHYRRHQTEEMERMRRAVEELKDSYVAAKLGLPVQAIPAPLLELKRGQLETRRLNKSLIQHIAEQKEKPCP